MVYMHITTHSQGLWTWGAVVSAASSGAGATSGPCGGAGWSAAEDEGTAGRREANFVQTDQRTHPAEREGPYQGMYIYMDSTCRDTWEYKLQVRPVENGWSDICWSYVMYCDRFIFFVSTFTHYTSLPLCFLHLATCPSFSSLYLTFFFLTVLGG